MHKKVLSLAMIMAIVGVSCTGCSKKSDVLKKSNKAETEETEEVTFEDGVVDLDNQKRTMTYADGSYIFHNMVVDESAKPMPYDLDNFVNVDGRMTYEGDDYTYRLGVDVSKYQDEVKWNKVERDGYDFAIIRLGYRGYTKGEIFLDERYEYNVKAANRSGLDVGVYFFSQAISENEAIEEARFVLEHVKDEDISMPIVYDPEIVYKDNSRTKNITKEQFTKNVETFCSEIREAGYDVMVYANLLWEDKQLDMGLISYLDIWYADYVGLPQTPYDFKMWQYTDSGTVDGIKGGADINIQLIKKE